MKYLLMIPIVAAGLAGGYYVSQNECPFSTTSSPAAPASATVRRIPLTAADAKDTLEAGVATVDADGQVYVAWASRTRDDERSLFLIRSSDAGLHFDTPRVMARTAIHKAVSNMRGKTITRELRMVPHLSANADGVHLAWTEALPENAGVRLIACRSTDRGETFDTPKTVHGSDKARPTFTSFSASPDGTLVASWLDNRNGAQQCYAAARNPGSPTFDLEEVVHSGDDKKGVCPCCPTASLIAPDGTIFVAFRNLADGFRDVGLAVKKPGETQFRLVSVVPPTWKFNGCPHDGPSLARVGNTIHVTWMAAPSGSPRCYHAFADMGKLEFAAQELHGIATGSQGNAKLLTDRNGVLHAVWEESESSETTSRHSHEPSAPTMGTGGRAILHSTLAPGATRFSEPTPVAPKTGAFQTRPFIADAAGALIIGWNELDESGKFLVVTQAPPCCSVAR